MVRLVSLHWNLFTCILCNDVDLALLLLNGPSLEMLRSFILAAISC